MKLSFEKIILKSIRESMGHLLDEPSGSEESVQDKMTHSLKPFKTKSKKKGGDNITDEEENVEKEKSDGEEKEVKQKVAKDMKSANADKILKSINLIRSGKSSKDKETKNSFMNYYASLTDEEQLALQAFVDGLADIFSVDEDESPTDVARPFSEPYNLKIKKDVKTKTTVKKSDDSSPIIVGEVANKMKELNTVRKNNR